MEKHNGTYRDLHRPASEFATRDEYLEHELQIMQPKRWRPNLPFRDYRFEWEDLIPAMAGTIGKVVMVGGRRRLPHLWGCLTALYWKTCAMSF